MHGLSEQRRGPRGDYLIGVHVGRCSTAGLEHVHYELGIVSAVHHFLRRSLDGASNGGGQGTGLLVGPRRCELHQSKRVQERASESDPADGKILDRALGLGAIQGVGRDGHFAHGVMFSSKGLGHVSIVPTLSAVRLFGYIGNRS